LSRRIPAARLGPAIAHPGRAAAPPVRSPSPVGGRSPGRVTSRNVVVPELDSAGGTDLVRWAVLVPRHEVEPEATRWAWVLAVLQLS
jgi:hypothetical protein